MSDNTTLPNEIITVAAANGRLTHRAGGSGVQNILSNISILANFLPTNTLLIFEIVISSIYYEAKCSHVTTIIIAALLSLCVLSCVFFHFTDSFVGPDNEVHYGFLTFNGLIVFNPGYEEVQVPERYKLMLSDFIHAIMSVIVFLAIAFTDHRVNNCVFPGYGKEIHQRRLFILLMVGISCRGLLLIFPNTRHGIECVLPLTTNESTATATGTTLDV